MDNKKGELVDYGDLHLRDSVEWGMEVNELIIKTLHESPYNNENNYAIFGGDMLDGSTPSPELKEQLDRLLSGLRYKKVFICHGNHTYSKFSAVKKDALASYYDTLFPNVEVIAKPSIREVEGKKILFLPFYYRGFYDLPPMDEHYAELPEEFTKEDYFLISGHFADETIEIGHTIDLSYLNSKYRAMGHIHNPEGHFTGSFVPVKISERGEDRRFGVYDLDTGERRYEPLPRIVDYYDITFPNELSSVDTGECMVPIYVVNGCISKEIALDEYGKIFIHSVNQLTEEDTLTEDEEDQEYVGEFDIKGMFNELAVKNNYSDRVKELVNKKIDGKAV